MPINRKNIPAMLADTGGWQTDNDGLRIKPIWSADESARPIDPYDRGKPSGTPFIGHVAVDLYALPPGKQTTPHFHTGHVEVVICWKGSGTVTFAEHDPAADTFADPPYQSAVSELYTMVMPKHAWHSFRNTDASNDLVLIIVHALNGSRVTAKTVPLPSSTAVAIPAANVRDYQRYLKEPGEQFYYFFNNNPNLRAERKRVWGRDGYYIQDAGSIRAGDPDHAKEQLHVTNYCFEEGQENPGHFHPFSIELVIAVEGKTTMIAREKQMHTQSGKRVPKEGWPQGKPADRTVIEYGDTVLVPVAGWHRYINFKENYQGDPPALANNSNRSLVVAMQTPHPIMHTLEMETNF